MKALETTAEIFSKSISADELQVWTVVLSPISDQAVSWAFDNWNRNGRYFPKPSEILELIQAYQSSLPQPHRCSPECERRHGRGYHGNDVVWLFKKYLQALKADPKAKPEKFLDELDSRRQGGAPEWRKVGGTAARPMEHEPISDQDIPF